MTTPPDPPDHPGPTGKQPARFDAERRHDGELIIFTFAGAVDDATVDRWRDALDVYVDERPGLPRYCVYDLTGITDWGLTPRARERLTLGAVLHPNDQGWVAIVTPPMGPLRAVVDLFLRSQLSTAQPNIEMRIFSVLDEGMAWVVQNLPPSQR